MKNKTLSVAAKCLTTLGVASMTLLAAPLTIADDHAATETYDGLVLVPDSKAAVAYVHPEADFSTYNKIMMLDCYVAFKKNWEKKQARTGSRVTVSASDMERIKTEVAIMFREVFAEELSKDGGYEIVDEAGEDVLLIRPAIIDLDIAAPDTSATAGRSRTYTTESGSATVFIELYDSATGDILARAADRRVARSAGSYLTYTNRVTNQADGRRMMRRWAQSLRAALDEYHGK